MKKKLSVILLIVFEVIFLLTATNSNLNTTKPSTPGVTPPEDVTDVYEKTDEKLRLSTRGVWHRPNCMGNETSLQGINDVLDVFAETGINLVFVETFYHGMTTYRSQYVPYYKGFDSYDYGNYGDYLTAFAAEAKKRGIQTVAWVEDFYVGVNENYFTKYVPDWMLVNAKGEIRQSEGNGYLFLDPANSDARSYLIRIYREMLSKIPDLAGINLDYIRYPLSSSADDTGFTVTAMEQFANKSGFELSADNMRERFIARIKSENLYSEWTEFRADCVTQFVKEVSETVRSNFPNAFVSTAVFPDADTTYQTKKQNFSLWIKQGLIDVVTPMAYYDNENALKSALKDMLADCGGCYCYAGLSAVYHNLPVDAVLRQLDVCGEAGADGAVFFGSQYLLNNDEYIRALKKSDNNVRDVVAHEKSLYLVNAVSQSIEAKLVKDGKDEAEVSEFIKVLDKIKTLPPDTVESVGHLKEQLADVQTAALRMTEQNAAQAREELEYLEKLIKLRLRFLQNRH